MPELETKRHTEDDGFQLDELDRRILRALQADADGTNQALAERVHSSPATCLRRVRRLKALGAIRRVTAQLDDRCVGDVVRVIVEVSLDRQGSEHLDAFEAHAAAHPAVQQCYRVSPGPDFLLIAVCTGMTAWTAVSRELLTQAANVRNVKAYFCGQAAKAGMALPID